MEQRIRITSLTAGSPTGASWVASAWFGGVGTHDASAWFHVSFLDGTGAALGSPVTLGGVSAAERNYQNNRWIQRSASGTVPTGAEWAVFEVSFDSANPTCGCGGDSGIDEMYFSMAPAAAIPEPGFAALSGLGAAVFLNRRPRKIKGL